MVILFVLMTSIQSLMRRKNGNLLWLLSIVGLVTVLLTLAWSQSSSYLNVVSSSISILPSEYGSSHAGGLSLINHSTTPDSMTPGSPEREELEEAWRIKVASLLKGKPTDFFKDNLLPEVNYITVWVSGGWTNDFMSYINMIYLSTLTGRTPILPPFSPSHVSWDGGFMYFSDIFDLPKLSAAIGTTILEWHDVKKIPEQGLSDKNEEVGCWSVWSFVSPEDDRAPRPSVIPHKLRLDVSYTGLPESSVRLGGFGIPFWTLAKLSFSSRREEALAEKTSILTPNEANNYIPPDDHLMCFDMMYYVGVQDNDEWWLDWSPAWNFVGKHATWNPKLQKLGLSYIHRALGLWVDDNNDNNNGEIPPVQCDFYLSYPQSSYIAVHARRGDFLTQACRLDDPEACFNHMVVYAEHVAKVNQTLSSKGIQVPKHNVIVTSDEENPQWWKEVEALGWHYTNHTLEMTAETYGAWYPTLLDAVTQSLAVGFVGTQFSTYSLVSSRRVKDWRGGAAEFTTLKAFE